MRAASSTRPLQGFRRAARRGRELRERAQPGIQRGDLARRAHLGDGLQLRTADQRAAQGGDDRRSAGPRSIFCPTEAIFATTEFNYDTLAQRLREMAFLNKGLEITLTDERTADAKTGEAKRAEFKYAGGIAEFVKHSEPRQAGAARQADRDGGDAGRVEIEIALQYNDSYSETVFSFANNINTVDGGSHLSGFRTALTRTINAIGQQLGLFKDMKENLSGDDVREGLVAVVSVKLSQPQFEGQTKGKLNSDIAGTVQAFVNERLGMYPGAEPAGGQAHHQQGD